MLPKQIRQAMAAPPRPDRAASPGGAGPPRAPSTLGACGPASSSLLPCSRGGRRRTASAGASDPGRWKLSSVDRLAPLYRGGLSADGAGHVFWSGAGEGLFRSSTSLAEQLRLGAAIPPALRTEPGFALVGDPGWDASGSGRLVVPFRCAVGASSATCPQAGLGIYDRGLLWGQFVRLDRSAATSIDWAEPSPDGLLVWTSSGRDLLAFSAADVRPGNGVPLVPVARFAGVVPLSRVTGATFMGGRLWLAGDGAGRLQAWSARRRRGPRERRAAGARPRDHGPAARSRRVRRARRHPALGGRADGQGADVPRPAAVAAELRPRRGGGARGDVRAGDAARGPSGLDRRPRRAPLRGPDASGRRRPGERRAPQRVDRRGRRGRAASAPAEAGDAERRGRQARAQRPSRSSSPSSHRSAARCPVRRACGSRAVRASVCSARRGCSTARAAADARPSTRRGPAAAFRCAAERTCASACSGGRHAR